MERRDDFVLTLFGVHECQCIVVLENNHRIGCSGSPDAEHGTIHDVGKASLGIVSISFPLGSRITSPAKKPSFSFCKRRKASQSGKLSVGPPEAFKVPRKSTEVFGLELRDHPLREFGLLGEGVWLSTVIRTMSELFTHEAVIVMSVEGLFSDCSVRSKIIRPTKLRPAHSSNSCMHVSRLNSIEVSPVIEKVPFYCSDDVGFTSSGQHILATAVCTSPDSTASRYLQSLKRFPSIAPTM